MRDTTVTADRSMMERDMKADARRKVVDKVAAAVLLQAWLEGPGREFLDAVAPADGPSHKPSSIFNPKNGNGVATASPCIPCIPFGFELRRPRR